MHPPQRLQASPSTSKKLMDLFLGKKTQRTCAVRIIILYCYVFCRPACSTAPLKSAAMPPAPRGRQKRTCLFAQSARFVIRCFVLPHFVKRGTLRYEADTPYAGDKMPQQHATPAPAIPVTPPAGNRSRRAVYLLFRLLAVCTLLYLAGTCLQGCAPRTPQGQESGLPSSDVPRADPGYVQWLSRQSMLSESQRLADIVSGSALQWRKGGLRPAPAALLREADTWLTVRPESVLGKSSEPVFGVLSDRRVWQALQKLGIRGMLPAPIHVTGGLWGYDLTAVRGDDIIQYGFADACGTQEHFLHLLRMANAHGAVLGTMLTPAATGMGPDFFLAARGKPGYAGIYCMIDLPRDSWKLLPAVQSEWQGTFPDEAAVTALRGKGLLPPPLAAARTGNPLRWAVTGEVRGIDGELRRWAYLAHEVPTRPVLNWTDPSAAARRIMSGSVIRQTGELGTALAGLTLQPFSGAVIDENDQRGPAAPLLDAARTLAAENRRYGGWSLLTDTMQLPLLTALLDSGPDMAVDMYTPPMAAHALLTGNAQALRLSLDMLRTAGIDHRRLMHPVMWGHGIDYTLAHLAPPPYGPEPVVQWQDSRIRASAVQRHIMDQLRAAVDEPVLHRATAGRVYCTTPAGIAAQALGLKDQRTGLRAITPEIIRGTLLLASWNALLPGGFMLDGRDLAGAMPLPAASLPEEDVEQHPELLGRGAYALGSGYDSVMISRQGLPAARTLHDSLPAQMLHDGSYGSAMASVLSARRRLGVPLAELVDTPAVSGSGTAATVLALPPDNVRAAPRWLLVCANFSRRPQHERFTLRLPPAVIETAKDILPADGAFAPAAAPTQEPQRTPPGLQNGRLSIRLQPWEIRALLLEAAPAPAR
jgi:trehalose synthase